MRQEKQLPTPQKLSWKTAPPSAECVPACECVRVPCLLGGLTCEFVEQHTLMHAHLPRRAKPRKGSVGRAISSGEEGQRRGEHTGNDFLKDR